MSVSDSVSVQGALKTLVYLIEQEVWKQVPHEHEPMKVNYFSSVGPPVVCKKCGVALTEGQRVNGAFPVPTDTNSAS